MKKCPYCGRFVQNELTQRELQVARLIVKGLRNKDMAEILEVSPRTIKTHIENISRKFNVQNRTEIAVRMVDLEGKMVSGRT